MHQNRDDWVQLVLSLIPLVNTGVASGVRKDVHRHILSIIPCHCPPSCTQAAASGHSVGA